MLSSYRLRRVHTTANPKPVSFILCLTIGLWLLASPAAAGAPPHAHMIIDAVTGDILSANNADDSRYPASLTKVMTLYVLFSQLKAGKVDLGTRLVVSANAAAQAPSRLGLDAGETISVNDAIRALVTKSANDIAVVVAENIGGSEENFARMMTATARRIGMTATTFRNASGLPDGDQVTCARDMITLARRIMQDHPQFYEVFSTKQFTYAGRRYKNHNKLLSNYKGTDGIKTGYTRASGFNLLASVRRDDRHLIGVVMGGRTASQRDAEMRRLLDKALPKAVAYREQRQIPLPNRSPTAPGNEPPYTAALASVTALRVGRKPAAPAAAQVEEGDASATDFQVQVGAYASMADAARRLADVQSTADQVLSGRQPLTLTFADGNRPLYRARFAGFNEEDARQTCDHLKRRDIACVVMRAE